MVTTVPSSLSSVALAAFSDELEKIAADESRQKSKFKNWAKNTAYAVGGVGAGTAVAMGINELVGPKLKPAWDKLSPRTKMLIAAPVIGAGSLGAMYLAHRLKQEREKNE